MENEVLIGGIEKREIVIVDYDPLWPNKFLEHKKRIEVALKGRFILIEHIGSTSVPQLAAKPIIDIIIVVEDSSNEATYLPALLDAGYVLRVREPEWHQHRMVRTPERDVHAHIFSLGCPGRLKGKLPFEIDYGRLTENVFYTSLSSVNWQNRTGQT
ncbi:GrpB family protein [Nitrosomonas sp. Nm33]|uniref:GrpB family protein n=1 Tax=Nitrosomonas sp. Nm33 TaxID=133724 RepID=UPI001C40A93B|nr:GrpB family protein [Nitrosomonas sp. Nm33]